MTHNLLIIGHNWPQPQSTAAGTRMVQLINLFKEAGYEITFVCAAPLEKESHGLSSHGINTMQIFLNDASFDTFITSLCATVVLYDRYITEEQYGWRVRENLPNAITLLDTEDLHFLRKAREHAVTQNLAWSDTFFYTQTAKRELASILRCDVSLIISEFEMNLLTTTFNIPKTQLCYLPFLVNQAAVDKAAKQPSFMNRLHFVTIGTFMHKPNVDAVLILSKQVWPLIKKALPHAQMHVYGSYVTQQMLQLHKPTGGFYVHGQTADALETLSQYRVLLAPLRYGAGLKGKIMDAMCSGTPAVMTTIAAEGMFGDLHPCGLIENDFEHFAAAAVQLHEDQQRWDSAVEHGLYVLEKRFGDSAFAKALLTTIHTIYNDLKTHRNNHFLGSILHYHTLQSTKYLSKWIAAKLDDNGSQGVLGNTDF